MINQPPDWLFRKVQVDDNDLKKVQEELKRYAHKVIIPIGQAGFYFIDPADVEKQSPTYAVLLKKLNLYDRWVQSGFSVTLNNAVNGYNTAHIDHHDTDIRCFAFNVPLLNCHDSYTIFYRSKTNHPGKSFDIKETYRWEDHRNALIFTDEHDLEEIARYPADECAFINVSVPHRPVTYHNEFRVLITSRFSPELFDYFKD